MQGTVQSEKPVNKESIKIQYRKELADPLAVTKNYTLTFEVYTHIFLER